MEVFKKKHKLKTNISFIFQRYNNNNKQFRISNNKLQII